MTCLACQEREHDCCDNHLFPGTCECGCVRVLDPPPLRSRVVIILGQAPHDPRECYRLVYNANRRQQERRKRDREVA
jgi:hypothetical protein